MSAEGIFVGSTIFQSENAMEKARSIVMAVLYHKDPEMLSKIALGYTGKMELSPEKKDGSHFFYSL